MVVSFIKSYGFNFEQLQTLVCDFKRIVFQIRIPINRFQKTINLFKFYFEDKLREYDSLIKQKQLVFLKIFQLSAAIQNTDQLTPAKNLALESELQNG